MPSFGAFEIDGDLAKCISVFVIFEATNHSYFTSLETTTLVILLGILITLLNIALAVIIVINAQKRKIRLLMVLQEADAIHQRQILEITMSTQEKERQKLGSELHDDLGPTFSALKLNLEVIAMKEENSEARKNALNRSIHDLDDAIAKFSDVSRLLYPVALNSQGLKGALSDLVYRLNRNSKCYITLDMSDIYFEKKELELAIFRICQELLNNGVKHSWSSKILLSIKEGNELLSILYSDEGKGFDSSTSFTGIGLESIRGRIMAFEGALDIVSNAEQGTKIKIEFNHDKNSNR